MKPIIVFKSVSPLLILINVVICMIYFSWWFFPSHVGNPWLYGILFAGELYHVIMALTFWSTVILIKSHRSTISGVTKLPSVDIFIPVVNEPVDVVRETALAARDQLYSNHQVFLLNDGKVAGNSNWQAMEYLAQELGIKCITRSKPGGAKAGNLNHALRLTQGEFIAIFDADMVPHPDFLMTMMAQFDTEKVGFVQSPQYYKNYAENVITASAWDQQKLFFGPILSGKEKFNAVFICGTNVVIRRSALEGVGGMVEDNIAEDFLTSLNIHKSGWQSHYVPEVLAEGLAPQDLDAYYKQQFRWCRGSLEILFGHNPLFSSTLAWNQKIQYLASSLYYLNGLIILFDMIMPLIYLFTGIQPVAASTTSFAIFFLPFMFVNLYTLYVASGKDITFNTFSFSYSLWYLQIQALISLLTGRKVRFSVTPKEKRNGNYSHLAIPHLLYICLGLLGSYIAINRDGISPSVITNVAWVLFSVVLFMPFIRLALGSSSVSTYKASPVYRQAI